LPTWGAILYELNKAIVAQQKPGQPVDPLKPSPHDVVRRKYIKRLSEHTGHPVIVYASGWLEGRPVPDPSVVSVSTRDLMGFMEAVHDLPKGPLDLMLHSPGGDPNAAEAIMNYLRAQGFSPIRALVPISAMSAATMMALCCDEVVMGRHSQLGPIDPQFTIVTPDGPRSAPAQAILDQFDRAKGELATSPQSLAAWLPILRGYGPGLLSQCVTSQEASEDFVAGAMKEYMFAGDPDAEAKAKTIAGWFNDHKSHRSHGKPLRFDDVEKQGIKVTLLENDKELQDHALSAWHGVQLSLSNVAVSKLIENSKGATWLISGSPGMLIVNPQPAPGPTPATPAASSARAVKSPNRSARRRQDKGK
jgi:hypothetical protein